MDMMLKQKILITVIGLYSIVAIQSTVCATGFSLNDNKENGAFDKKPNKIKSVTIPYSPVTGLITSPDFTVLVNNIPVWTERVGNGGMEDLNVANFSCFGPQTITITGLSDITKYEIKPKSKGIVAQINGKQLTFTITEPQKLYIEINNLAHLAVFANPIEVNPPKKGGNGILFYGPGRYNIGELQLQNNQTVYIAAGAVVDGNIRGTNLQNIKIQGCGILNGNIQIAGSSNIDINGIFIRNTRGWSNTLIDCDRISYSNVKIFSYKEVWGIDGIDPVSCRNFTIDNCFIRTKDDCISIKSMYEFGGYKIKNINTDSINITNCLLVGWSHADGFTLGFELQGGFVQNVLVKNCDIISSSGQGRTGGHSAFSIVCDGPANVQNISFEDIRVENQIEYKNLELIITEGRRYGTAGPGHIKGVYLKNIHWENPNKPFVIAGIPSFLVEDVTFDKCYLAGKVLTGTSDADFQMEFVKEIKFIP